MDKNIKLFFVKSIAVLVLIHLAYFIYGYIKFEGLQEIGIYTEFYRFKFYDDVSISHFFVSGIFLFFFLLMLLRNHSKKALHRSGFVKIGALLLLVSFFAFTFFISYSFGLNAKLRTQLPEKDLNTDKILLNVLQPFLYSEASYSSEKLFNPENILYPKPYPVIGEVDTVYLNPVDKDYSSTETNYYSIDTLKILRSDERKLGEKVKSVFDVLGLDAGEFKERIISKKEIGDSTEVIFKGMEVYPEHDDKICIFLENKSLFSPLHRVSQQKQQYDNAVERYYLLYSHKQDSLLRSFERLDNLFKKYGIESQIVPKELNNDVFYYRDHQQESLSGLRNTYDRNGLIEKFKTLERLFYTPNYIHPSIRGIFFTIVGTVWLTLFFFYLGWNLRKSKSLPST